MKNRDNKITINNLLYALLFLVVGMMLFTAKESVLTMVSKIIGCIFIVAGGVKTIIYIYMKGKLGNYKFNSLLIGLIFIAIGIVFIVCSGALDWAVRVIIGLWTIFAGVNRMIFAFTYKKYYNEGFKVYFLTSLFMIILGIVVLSGLFSKILGLLIVVYAITEIYNYVYYKIKGKEMPSDDKAETKLPAVKNEKVVEAQIEESEEEDK